MYYRSNMIPRSKTTNLFLHDDITSVFPLSASHVPLLCDLLGIARWGSLKGEAEVEFKIIIFLHTIITSCIVCASAQSPWDNRRRRGTISLVGYLTIFLLGQLEAHDRGGPG